MTLNQDNVSRDVSRGRTLVYIDPLVETVATCTGTLEAFLRYEWPFQLVTEMRLVFGGN